MLVKTGEVKEVNNRVQVIYKNKLTGKTGVLSEQTFRPSNKVSNKRPSHNRAATEGRHIQRVKEKVGERKGIKTITTKDNSRKRTKVMKPIMEETNKLIKH